MVTPKKHTIENGKDRYKYLLFDSVGKFNDFVDKQASWLQSSNDKRWKDLINETRYEIKKGSDWYGTPRPQGIAELENHKTFLGMPLLEKLRPKIKAHLQRYMDYLDAGIMPKPKLAYNDRGLGVFSFDRAAMGMYKLSHINLSTPIDTLTSQLNIELGRAGLKTATKKVYGFFRDKETSYPSMRLYLMAGANANVEGDQMLYLGLACSELAKFMELRGVPVEVNVIIGTFFRGSVKMSAVRLKRFQDKLDTNQLLLMSSDPRYYRFRGFKSLIAIADYFGNVVPSGLGKITPDMAKGFVNALGDDGFVFEQSYSLEAAAKEVKRIIETYSKKLNDGKAA